jgi:hypothetical protein
MGYNPTIAECRAAAVEKCQISRSTTQFDNAEGNGAIKEMTKWSICADLTTALTGGAMSGKCVNYLSFIDPLTADYTANIGDTCDVLTIDSSSSTTAPTDAGKWLYTAQGWQKFLTVNNSLTSRIATTAATMATIWGKNSATTGTIRALSVRSEMSGTGTEDGESLRAYTLIDGTITGSGVHGAHITAQIGSETVASTASCTGEVAGVRATIGIGLTDTGPAGGTIASLRLDSYFQSTAASAASSYIYACDVSTYGVDAFLRLGTMVSKTTSKTAMTAAYAYVSGGMTVGAATAALKVVTPDGAFYIPLLAAAALT